MFSNKSLAFTALLLCVVLVQQATSATKKRAKKLEESDSDESDSDASDSDDDDESGDESEEDDSDDEKETKKKSSKKSSSSRTNLLKGKSKTDTKKSTKGTKKSGKSDVSTDQKNRFVLPNFKKSAVVGKGSMKRKWKTKSYEVHYERRGNNIALTWKKGSDEVTIAKSQGGNIAQEFKFGNASIAIAVAASAGGLTQDWNLGTSHYSVAKMPGLGTVTDGSVSKSTINKYKKLISAWCKANDFFVGKKNCVLY